MPKDYNLHLRGAVGDWNFSADMVSYILDKNKDKEVNVLIDSLGGRVNTALSISSLFSIHGNVHAHFVGMCASAATIAPMGCKRISMDADALMLVHKCSNLVFEWDYMNADELAAHIKELEKMRADQQTIDGCIAGMYAKRCKKSKDDLLALMEKGAWLTAKEALEWGFIDEITNEADDHQPKLTDETLNFINAEGIPMPPIQTAKKGSIMERFVAFLNSQFSPAAAQHEPEPVEPQEPAAPINSIEMDLKFISASCGNNDIKAVDGKVTFAETEANAIESALADNAKSIEAKDKEIAELKAKNEEAEKTIAELKKQPAEETQNVVENGDTKDDVRNSDDVQKNVDWLLAQTM